MATAARTVASRLRFEPVQPGVVREAEVTVVLRPRSAFDGGELILSSDRVRITASTTEETGASTNSPSDTPLTWHM